MKKMLTAFAVMMLATWLACAQAGQGQTGQGQPAQAGAPSQEEITAIRNAMDSNTPPDARIMAAEEFLAKFPNSLIKTYAYLAEMEAYREKNDAVNAIDAADKALKLDPNNLPALAGAAEILAMRTRDNDLDREQKLKKGEDYANRAIKLLEATVKPPGMPDDQFLVQKNGGLANVYASLAWFGYHRKQLTVAETNFKKAFDLDKQATYAYYLGRAYAQDGKLQPGCEAYQQAQTLGGVKNSAGLDLVEADRKALDKAMLDKAEKEKGPAVGCPAGVPPPAAPAPAVKQPAPQKP